MASPHQPPAAASVGAGRTCRLIIDPPTGGAWNMAVDEALLESAAAGGPATLRFYGWAEPTLSLGYFQPYEERLIHRASRSCAVVRRSSGGGAILHDREVTYSLAVPGEQNLADDSTWLYRAAHQGLVEVLYTLGIEAHRVADPSPRPAGVEPFLCFQRRASGDVVAGDAKVCGSAQRRRRGAILQHGSLILERSPAAPELAGLAEILGRVPDAGPLVEAWAAAMARHLGWRLEPGKLTAAEQASVRGLTLEKFSADTWTRRR